MSDCRECFHRDVIRSSYRLTGDQRERVAEFVRFSRRPAHPVRRLSSGSLTQLLELAVESLLADPQQPRRFDRLPVGPPVSGHNRRTLHRIEGREWFDTRKRPGAHGSSGATRDSCCNFVAVAEMSFEASSRLWRHWESYWIMTFSTTRSTTFTIGTGSTWPQRRQFAWSAHCTSSHCIQRVFARSSHIGSPLAFVELLFQPNRLSWIG